MDDDDQKSLTAPRFAYPPNRGRPATAAFRRGLADAIGASAADGHRPGYFSTNARSIT